MIQGSTSALSADVHSLALSSPSSSDAPSKCIPLTASEMSSSSSSSRSSLRPLLDLNYMEGVRREGSGGKEEGGRMIDVRVVEKGSKGEGREEGGMKDVREVEGERTEGGRTEGGRTEGGW